MFLDDSRQFSYVSYKDLQNFIISTSEKTDCCLNMFSYATNKRKVLISWWAGSLSQIETIRRFDCLDKSIQTGNMGRIEIQNQVVGRPR